ncbi:MAG: glutathione peroxidase [Prolixibacteraceae bacterium]|nr:glutathione peroxidase [Prolixibacteraceae bacterium]
MRTITLIISILFAGALLAQDVQNFHQFTVNDISGKPYRLDQLNGKKVLVVNTASKCGLTPQYDDLEKLYQTYKEKNFIIIGFPANNFMKQEPGTNDEIAEFCRINYGVSFPMMEKISVKSDDMHPLYQWLTTVADTEIQWNFQKFMINPDGTLHGFVSPRTKPFDEKIISWIEKQ